MNLEQARKGLQAHFLDLHGFFSLPTARRQTQDALNALDTATDALKALAEREWINPQWAASVAKAALECDQITLDKLFEAL